MAKNEPEIKVVQPKKVEPQPVYFEPKAGHVILVDKKTNREFEVNDITYQKYFTDTTKWEVKKKHQKQALKS